MDIRTQMVTNETMAKAFAEYERQVPFPQSVAPSIPQGQQLGTVDKLAQAVIPRLVDMLNEANWKIERLTAQCNYQQMCLDDLYKVINETLLPQMQTLQTAALQKSEKKPRKPRQKKEVVKSEVDMSEIADYDPDTDTWGAMVIDGHRITGALIDVVEHLNGAADQMYSDELIQFIHDLEPRVKAAIAERFPN